ncbi:hypothetical protein TEQG_06806 [Trichophyton equinum CBS 127.97]|uniref:Uncharacterized protein n=1 Tax=Trichophyton equinum (strain ATCC MYA-4606 / CBS 127.97) TaxID=559882 RepID=F2Q0V6_TRIEC|nr:hypothetical protein TEQG_06806 [Trichophyton equinum CBS 127.97]
MRSSRRTGRRREEESLVLIWRRWIVTWILYSRGGIEYFEHWSDALLAHRRLSARTHILSYPAKQQNERVCMGRTLVDSEADLELGRTPICQRAAALATVLLWAQVRCGQTEYEICCISQRQPAEQVPSGVAIEQGGIPTEISTLAVNSYTPPCGPGRRLNHRDRGRYLRNWPDPQAWLILELTDGPLPGIATNCTGG